MSLPVKKKVKVPSFDEVMGNAYAPPKVPSYDEVMGNDSEPNLEKKNLGGNDYSQNFLDPTIGLKNTTPLPSKAPLGLQGIGDETFALNPASAIEKKPQVDVVGQQVEVTKAAIPFTKPNKQSALELQQRINSGTFTNDDVVSVAESMKVSVPAAKAYMSGDKASGTVIEFDERKVKNLDRLINTVKKANADLGLNDDFNIVLSTPEIAGSYIEKIQDLYDKKSQSEILNLNSPEVLRERAVRLGLTPDEAVIEDVGLYAADKFVDPIKRKNSQNVNEIKGIVGKRILDLVNDQVINNELTYEQGVEKASKLVDKREYNTIKSAEVKRIVNSVSLNPFAQAANIYNDLSGDTDKEKEVLNSTKAGVELGLNRKIGETIIYNNALLEKTVNEALVKQEKGILTDADKQTYQATIDKIKATNDIARRDYKTEKQIQDKYPVLFKKELVDKINEFNAIKSGNVKGYEDNGYKDISIFDFLKNNGYDVNDQRVQDVLENSDTKDYSFFGRPVGSIIDVFSSSAKSLMDLTGGRDELDILADKKRNELYPKQVNPNDEYQLTDARFNGITDFSIGAKNAQTIGNTTGQVVGQGLFQAATSGIGRMAGLSKVAAANAGFWSSGALTSYDDAYKNSMDFVDGEAGRVAYAGLIALSNAASEKIFPEAKLFQIPGVKDAVAEISQNIGKKAFTEELANGLLKKAKNAFVDYAVKYGKNVSQEVAEEVATDLFESGTRFLFGDPNITVDKAIESAKNTAIQTALGMSFIGGFGAYKDVQNERNTSAKSIIYNAALYHDEAMDAINKGYEEKLYSEQEKDAKIQTLNTARSAINVTTQTENINGITLSRPQKELYVANITAESLLRKEKEGVDDDLLKGKIDEKISNLQNQRNQILKGEVNFDENNNVIENKPTTNEIQSTESTQSTTSENKTPTGEDTQSKGAENTVAQNINSFTPQEQEAVNVINTIDFNTEDGKRVKIWTDLIQDENAPIADKKQALKDLSEQLADPNSEIPTGLGLGKATDAIYNLIQPTVKSAVIEINGKTYEGDNHAQAILNAKADGQDISQVNRQADGKFKLSDGTIIDRATAKQRFGEDKSELLIIQNEAADKANADYGNPKQTPPVSKVEGEVGNLKDNPIVVNMSLPMDSGVNTGLVKNSKGAVYHDRNTAVLKKLGYSDTQIDNFNQTEVNEILAKNIENPNVESSAKLPLAEKQTTTDEFINEAVNGGGHFAELAKALKKHFGLGEVKTSIVKGLKDFFGGKNDGDYANNQIRIDETVKNKTQIFLHEGIHKLTTDKLLQFERGDLSKLSEADIDAIKNLKRIFEESKIKIHDFLGGGKGDRTKGHYGFTDVHEFISEAFANPEFQRLLRKIPTEGKTPTLFKQFLDAVAKLLGIKDPSILNDIFYHTEKLGDKSKPTEPIQSKVEEGKAVEEIENTYKEEVHNEGAKIGELALEKIPTEKIVESDNPRGNRERHTEIMKRLSKINKLIKCK